MQHFYKLMASITFEGTYSSKGLSILWFQKYGTSTSVKLSCETIFFFILIEILILMKMDYLTITQRIKMIKTYYKNDDFDTATYRALSGIYNRPTIQAIGKIMMNFKEIGLVTNTERSVLHCFAPSSRYYK